jgi:hypothetical protein
MLKPFLVGLLWGSGMVAVWPAAAGAQQFGRTTTTTTTYTYYEQPQVGRSHRQRASDRVIYGDRFYNNYPSSIRQNGYSTYFDRSERFDGFHQPPTVIIIQQAPVYAYPSTCSTSVVGSPIPLPYARDTRTGLPCN